MGEYIHHTVIVTGHTGHTRHDDPFVEDTDVPDGIGFAHRAACRIFNKPGYAYKLQENLSFAANGLAMFVIPASGGKSGGTIQREHFQKLDMWKARVRDARVSWVEVRHGEAGPDIASDYWQYEQQRREEADPT